VLALQLAWEPIGSPVGPNLGDTPTVSCGYVEILPRIVGGTWVCLGAGSALCEVVPSCDWSKWERGCVPQCFGRDSHLVVGWWPQWGLGPACGPAQERLGQLSQASEVFGRT